MSAACGRSSGGIPQTILDLRDQGALFVLNHSAGKDS